MRSFQSFSPLEPLVLFAQSPEKMPVQCQSRHLPIEISGAQIRAARILLGWSQAQLCSQCEISADCLANIETGLAGANFGARQKVALALIEHGIDFINSVGVTLWPQGASQV